MVKGGAQSSDERRTAMEGSEKIIQTKGTAGIAGSLPVHNNFTHTRLQQQIMTDVHNTYTHTQCIHTCTYAHIHNTYIHTHIHANKRGFQLSRVQAPLRQGLASRLFTDGWQVIKCSIKRMEETLIRWIGGSTNTPVTSARLCL